MGLSKAEGTTLHITGQQVVAGGASFGATGPYEKVTGTLSFELDPKDPRNAVITDLSNAPRNANGSVEYSTEFYMLRPVDLSHWNHQIFYEVNNRGNIASLGTLDDAPSTNDPMSQSDFGNGFLFKQGYVYLSAGWEGDLLPSPDKLNIAVPVATHSDGTPITQRIAVEFSDDLNFNPNGTTTTLPLSGSSTFRSYPAVRSQMHSAQLWIRPSDSPRPPAVPIPQGKLVPRNEWSFTSPTQISLPGGFKSGMVYELDYVAQDPNVLGLAYAATRDVVSFFRYAEADSAGTPNPLPGVQHTIGWGASQSGAYLRDFIYQGFNASLAGQRVLDGVDIHIGGALLGQGENYRFGQLNPWSNQHRDRFLPNITFPFNFGVRENPLVADGTMKGPLRDGILKRPATDPLVFQTDSSAEYWWGGAGLENTDGFGHDVPLPWNARHYVITGTQHGAGVGAQPSLGICQQLSNPTRQSPALRALLVDLDDWVTQGVRPPDSRQPTVAAGTLVPPGPDRSSIGFPAIPGVSYDGVYNEVGEKDLGPQVHNNGGVITNWGHPPFLNTYKVLVPKENAVGIDQDGLEVPSVGVPTATLTGWNLRRVPYTVGDLCSLTGMYLPLPRTKAQAQATGDPRPSLEELYRNHDRYVADVTRFVNSELRERLILPDDAAMAISEARQSQVP